ncbi:MAG: hypothetical protein KJO26_14450 [Deltaproteobacteria bacterium]|nr:hypothetical protein [Deltaproteobacteria bacterium]NNK86474.1 hypothetical protein [Desulfobacterales bacterium]
MKEIDVALKALVDGLRTIGQGLEKLAEKLEESVPKKQSKAKPARKTGAKPKKVAAKKPASKKPAPKRAPVTKAVKVTAEDTVLAIINRSRKGVNSATLSEKTGFDKKKVANIVFRLRKQGKIKSVGRGVYTKA